MLKEGKTEAYYGRGVIQTWRRGPLLVRQPATRVSVSRRRRRKRRRRGRRKRRRRRSVRRRAAPSPTGRLAAALALQFGAQGATAEF